VAVSGDSRGYVAEGGELRLGNPGQLELLRGMAERGVPLRTGVRGLSMTPFIRDGDVVTFEPLRAAPEVGQVVAVALPAGGRMAVHRVVARRGERWVVRGDNCAEADGEFGPESFVGRVVRVERGGREVPRGPRGSAACIAALSRTGWLLRLRAARLAPRRAAGAALRAAQGLPAYRRAGRRLAPRVVVREATAADMAAVAARLGVLAVGSSDGGASDGAGPLVVRWVAEVDGRTAGFAELTVRGAEAGPWAGAWLFSLTVWTPYRGLGVGEALTREVLARAAACGAPELLIVVHVDNTPALRLYGKLGFAPASVPALEPLLAAEAARTGRRRVALRAATGDLRGPGTAAAVDRSAAPGQGVTGG